MSRYLASLAIVTMAASGCSNQLPGAEWHATFRAAVSGHHDVTPLVTANSAALLAALQDNERSRLVARWDLYVGERRHRAQVLSGLRTPMTGNADSLDGPIEEIILCVVEDAAHARSEVVLVRDAQTWKLDVVSTLFWTKAAADVQNGKRQVAATLCHTYYDVAIAWQVVNDTQLDSLDSLGSLRSRLDRFDPWDKPYRLERIGPKRANIVVCSGGPDCEVGTGDDIRYPPDAGGDG